MNEGIWSISGMILVGENQGTCWKNCPTASSKTSNLT